MLMDIPAPRRDLRELTLHELRGVSSVGGTGNEGCHSQGKRGQAHGESPWKVIRS
jgi:hypothetical protein